MTSYYVTTSGSDANTGTSEGNAWATPGYAASQLTTGDIVYVKEGTYTLTTTTQNVSGGPVLLPAATIMEGYKTTAGDRLAIPVINAGSVAPAVMFQLAASGSNAIRNACYNIKLDGNGQSITTGFDISASYNSYCQECIADDVTTGFLGATRNGLCYSCSALNCTTGFNKPGAINCFAKSCTNGFIEQSFNDCICCIASTCVRGFDCGGQYNKILTNCVAWNCSGDGFFGQWATMNFAKGCISVSNGGYGFKFGTGVGNTILFDCADYNNTLGRTVSTSTPNLEVRPVNLTGDPFVDPANDDFRLNDIAGAGLACQQIQATPLAGVRTVTDIGAIDKIVPGGGLFRVGLNGGM